MAADRRQNLGKLRPLLGLYAEWQKAIEASIDKSMEEEIAEMRRAVRAVEKQIETVDRLVEGDRKLLDKVARVLLRL